MVGRYLACITYVEYPTHIGYDEDYVLPNPPINNPPNAPSNPLIHAPPNPLIHAPPNSPIPGLLNTLPYL